MRGGQWVGRGHARTGRRTSDGEEDGEGDPEGCRRSEEGNGGVGATREEAADERRREGRRR